MARGSMAVKTDKTAARSWKTLRILLIIGAAFVCLISLGIVAAEAWDYTNSVAFCANTCHDVHPEEPLANQDSYHARIKCTECHMGRVSMVRGVILKSSHIRHLPAIIFDNYERPLVSETMRPASESCEQCHFPAAFHDDMAREIEHFLPDATNTGKLTYLLLRTGAGTDEAELGHGIHWHVTNPVDYIATDETKQDIRWARTTLPDGTTIEYNDEANPLSPEEIAQAEKRTMDCVDCHNRIGHPFPSPEKLVDEAMAKGRLSTDLPFAKREILALLTATYATQEEALAAADSLRVRYSTEFPDIAAAYAAEIDQAVQLVREFQTRLVFEEPGVTWQSFFDNTGHTNSDGCFRCHDGQHVTSDGSVIRLECSLCHNIPMTVNLGDPPPEIAIPVLEEPESHQDTRFVSTHSFQVDESCADCHGEVRFGTDDSSFCANSSCHGHDWPTLSMDKSFAHPVSLEGQHAEATCDSCHNGAVEIPQDCAGCHARPLDHLDGACEACHTPWGWTEIAVSELMVGGSIPHSIEPTEDCTICHDPYEQNWPAPIDHVGYSSAQCSVCHDLAYPVALTWDAALTQHALEGEHVWVPCVDCHQDGTFQGTPEDCTSCHLDDDAHAGEFGPACAECHIPAGWELASIDHATTAFPLRGQHQNISCQDCHEGSTYAGTPQDCWSCHQADDLHDGQLGKDCAECHTFKGWEGATFAHGSTAYALKGLHKQADCVQCHPGNQYSGTPKNCYACHQVNDQHNGQFGQACGQCHTPQGWQAVTFDHSVGVYPLTGRHTQVACVQCHQGNQYAGTPQNCFACHQASDKHNGQFGQACAQCHSTGGWQGASLDHNLTGFPLTGRHAGIGCASCHGGGSYQGTPTNCASCHGQPGYHAGVLGSDCASCHNTGGWLPASYNRGHSFNMNHEGAGGSCRTCHPSSLGSTDCSTCHDGPPDDDDDHDHGDD